jgi:hypothetical protein
MMKPHLTTSREEFTRKGQDYYDRFLRDRLEPDHNGKYLALDVETGEYEMDADEMAAIDRARARLPESPLYILRIGYPTADRIGAQQPRSRG